MTQLTWIIIVINKKPRKTFVVLAFSHPEPEWNLCAPPPQGDGVDMALLPISLGRNSQMTVAATIRNFPQWNHTARAIRHQTALHFVSTICRFVNHKSRTIIPQLFRIISGLCTCPLLPNLFFVHWMILSPVVVLWAPPWEPANANLDFKNTRTISSRKRSN